MKTKKKYSQSCPEHPEADIIPGLENYYCYSCKQWKAHPVKTNDKYAKWRGEKKQTRRKRK